MKKKYKHGEELRKFWRDQQRKYRAKKRAEKKKAENNEPKAEKLGFIFDKNGQPIHKYEVVDKIPPIRRQRRKQK